MSVRSQAVGSWILALVSCGCASVSNGSSTPSAGAAAAQVPTREPSTDDGQSSRTLVVEDGDRLFLLGTFDGQTPQRVLEALDRNPKIAELVFTANGGSVDDDATLELGRTIRTRGLATRVVADGAIASGGVSLFLAGTRRTVERGARIGVHSWEHCWGDADGGEPGCRQAMDHPREHPGHQLHGEYTEEMLGTRDFYWFAIEASPSDSIHWMSDAEIERFGLSTDGVVEERTEPPFGDAFRRERASVAPTGPRD